MLSDSFLVGNKEEVAIFMEDRDQEAIYSFKNPQITDVTIEEERGYDNSGVTISNGHTRPKSDSIIFPKNRHIKATITIETMSCESIWGDDIENELPDTVQDMSVEELLHAVNKKIQGDEQSGN